MIVSFNRIGHSIHFEMDGEEGWGREAAQRRQALDHFVRVLKRFGISSGKITLRRRDGGWTEADVGVYPEEDFLSGYMEGVSPGEYAPYLEGRGRLRLSELEYLFKLRDGESFSMEGEECFSFLNLLYNNTPGRTGSAYGLGLLVGGELGGYLASPEGLTISFDGMVCRIRAGEYTGRMIGRGGQNVRALTNFFHKKFVIK